MEAPEKLYLPKRNKLPLEVVRGGEWYETNPQCMYGSVEYIRKDAFIEKACEYLMEYEFNDSPTIADRRKRVENFKKYMEGE